jgi:hypothetical protein
MVDPALQGEVIAGALATVADAEREVGLEAAVQATLDRATAVAEAITDDLNRAQALARLAEVRTKAVGAAQDLFVRALSIAHTLPGDRQRAQALQVVAAAQASAGQRDTSALTFAEAIRLARNLDRDCSGYITRPPPYCLGEMEMLSRFADAQHRAGLINEAAATFDEALNAVLSGTEQWKQNHLLRLARRADTRTPRDDVTRPSRRARGAALDRAAHCPVLERRGAPREMQRPPRDFFDTCTAVGRVVLQGSCGDPDGTDRDCQRQSDIRQKPPVWNCQFSCSLLGPFFGSTRAASILPSRPPNLAAAARRACQGWPRLRGHPKGSALIGPSTAAHWIGSGLECACHIIAKSKLVVLDGVRAGGDNVFLIA